MTRRPKKYWIFYRSDEGRRTERWRDMQWHDRAGFALILVVVVVALLNANGVL